MRRDLPTGTVTFLFTDVEGSTALLHELGSERYSDVLTEHRRVVRAAVATQNGVEVDTQGDAFFVAFPTAPGALEAAARITRELTRGPMRLRIGVHTGTPYVADDGYIGEDVHRAARIAASGHGGQVLLSASTAALVGANELRDLGDHRLKDLSAPERIYQLGPGDFPPLKTLYRTNLPIPTTSFLGREQELSAVVTLLQQEDVRLLTLTGPGGTGKTRLGLRAAGEAADAFPDGVFWVPLAPLRDARLVLEAAAQAVGATDGFAEHVADKSVLLLLDNFEHLIDAATDVATVLSACPRLRVLVTSRERLRVHAEWAWQVPPLVESEGVELFAARARAIDASFTPSAAVDRLCARLDGLPLAIELAAARTALFSPEQLLERLADRLDLFRGDRDSDARQQTLRATIAWSHELLTPDEQRLFRCLSVFAGGCTYAAADAVASADPDTLQSLLDKSLLRKRDEAGEPRYWMLETIREFASEQLFASGEAGQLGTRHSDFFVGLAQEAEPFLRVLALRGIAHGAAEWLDRLEADHDNVRAALDRLEATGDTQQALELAGSLTEFWYHKNHFAEGERRLAATLAADDNPTPARAKALGGAADLAWTIGDDQASLHRAREALELNRSLGDRRGVADSLWRAGYAEVRAGDVTKAQELLAESVTLYEQLGDEAQLGAGRTLAWSYARNGEWERARVRYEEVVHQSRAMGNSLWEDIGVRALALVAVEQGRNDDALSLVRENLSSFQPSEDTDLAVETLCQLAVVLAATDNPELAVSLVAACQTIGEEAGLTVGWVDDLNEDTLEKASARLDAHVFAAAREYGETLTADDAFTLAREAVARSA